MWQIDDSTRAALRSFFGRINRTLQLLDRLLRQADGFLDIDFTISWLKIYKDIVIGELVAHLNGRCEFVFQLEQVDVSCLFRDDTESIL